MPRSGSPAISQTRAWSTDAGDGADGGAQRRDIVEHAERDEMIRAAGVVFAVLACPDQDSVAGGKAELAYLNVGTVMMKGDLAGNGDAALVRA